MRQGTGNNWPGIDQEQKVLERLEDVAVEEEGQGG